MQIKLTKAKSSSYLMNKNAESKTVFKFLEAQLLVNRIKPSPSLLLAHNSALEKGALAHYNLTTVELKSHVFWRSAIAFHRQHPVGTHPKTTSIHHGDER